MTHNIQEGVHKTNSPWKCERARRNAHRFHFIFVPAETAHIFPRVILPARMCTFFPWVTFYPRRLRTLLSWIGESEVFGAEQSTWSTSERQLTNSDAVPRRWLSLALIQSSSISDESWSCLFCLLMMRHYGDMYPKNCYFNI